MPIIPWKPFRDMFDFDHEGWGLEELPKFRGPLMRTPRIDIYETEKDVVAEVELPGIDLKNIEVEVRDNILKIEAKKEESKEEKGKGYYRKEISAGYYKRVVPLPVEVIGEKADAQYKEGVLKISIPKKEVKKTEKKPIKIKVKGTKID